MGDPQWTGPLCIVSKVTGYASSGQRGYFDVQIARDFRVKITCASSPNFGCLLVNLRWVVNAQKQYETSKNNASLSSSMPYDYAQLAKALQQVFPDIDVPQQDALVVANWRVAVDPRLRLLLPLVTGADPGAFSTVSGLPGPACSEFKHCLVTWWVSLFPAISPSELDPIAIELTGDFQTLTYGIAVSAVTAPESGIGCICRLRRQLARLSDRLDHATKTCYDAAASATQSSRLARPRGASSITT